MKRPLILAAVVALAIGLLALGVGLRDAAPSTHAQDATTATVAPAATATAAPVATATTAPAPTATAAPAATATASPATTTTTTTPTATSTCTATTPGVARTANEALAEDCDALLALRDKLPRPTALNWRPTLALTGWTGVRVSGTPKRVTALRLAGAEAPYYFRDALADLANPDALDALVDLHLAVYKTPRTTNTTATTLPANPPACGTQANKALKKDCDTLLKIESTLAGTATLNWGDPKAAFTSTNAAGVVSSGWDGILVGTVKGKVRVTGLELPDKSLTGVIPTQIEDLTALTSLALARNRLGGGIPTQIGNLANLTHLDLRNSELRGVIPTQIGNLAKLTDLRLDAYHGSAGRNHLSGTIPTQLGNLSSLETFQLHDRDGTMRGGIPPQLGNLSNLKSLDLRHGGRLGGSIPPQLGNLTKLEELRLVGLGLTGTIPPELGNLTELKKLRLISSHLTGAIPTQLGSLTKLESLDLRHTVGVCVPAGLALPATVRVLPALTTLTACPASN